MFVCLRGHCHRHLQESGIRGRRLRSPKAVQESFGLGVLEPGGPGLNPGCALAGCVTLGKLLNISEPQLGHQKSRSSRSI